MSNHSNPELGKLLTGDEQRDAIHIAIAPVVAVQKLHPGEHIGFAEQGNQFKVGKTVNPIGIVDPFLGGPVNPGERFYIWLYPRSVTGMRHEWEHPAFTAQAVANKLSGVPESERWLTEYAEGIGFSLGALVKAARSYNRTGRLCSLGVDSPDVTDEFWDHYEKYTGELVTNDKRDSFFTCAC